MLRNLFFLPLFILVFYSCNNRVTNTERTSFSTFEISYTNGWLRGNSFLVDSSKIYFSPQIRDSLNYGILPDSIFIKINDLSRAIIKSNTYKSKEEDCVDCPIIAIKINSGKKIFSINQIGTIDSSIYVLTKSIENFLKINNHQKIKSLIWLETKSIVSPPPPSPY